MDGTCNRILLIIEQKFLISNNKSIKNFVVSTEEVLISEGAGEASECSHFLKQHRDIWKRFKGFDAFSMTLE
jgi:hypothetical protein